MCLFVVGFVYFFFLKKPHLLAYIKQQVVMTLNASSLPTRLFQLSSAFSGGKKNIPFIPVRSKPVRKSYLPNNI